MFGALKGIESVHHSVQLSDLLPASKIGKQAGDGVGGLGCFTHLISSLASFTSGSPGYECTARRARLCPSSFSPAPLAAKAA